MNITPLKQETIDEITKRLVTTYHPREIYLLEPHREDDEDIDIIVIVDHADINRYTMMSQGHKALIGLPIAKNILVYTKEEFAEYSKDHATMSYSVKKYGKRIYANT